MSLYDPKELERDALLPAEALDALDYYVPSDICFKCGGVLSGDDVLIYAHGCEGSPCKDSWDEVNKLPSGYGKGWYPPRPQIWMHVDCAHDLALSLLKDYLKVKEERDRKEARARLGLPPDDT